MKKIIIALAVVLSVVSLYTHLDSKASIYKSSYDMPTKCKTCGKWHIPGTPCLK